MRQTATEKAAKAAISSYSASMFGAVFLNPPRMLYPIDAVHP